MERPIEVKELFDILGKVRDEADAKIKETYRGDAVSAINDRLVAGVGAMYAASALRDAIEEFIDKHIDLFRG